LKIPPILPFLAAMLASSPATGEEPSGEAERSFLVGVDLGTAVDLDPSSRRAVETGGERREAYAPAAFDFGFFAGFRFARVLGMEVGWHQSRHRADDDRGGSAGYSVGHLALRLEVLTAWSMKFVFEAGAGAGTFFYGAAGGDVTPVVGGIAGVCLEQELSDEIAGSLRIGYLPLYRWAMTLEQVEGSAPGEDGVNEVTVAGKDFGPSALVHVLWVTVGVQYEWRLP